VARGQKRNTPVVQQAGQALERLKSEIADEIYGGPDPQARTLQSWYQTGYGGDVPSRVWGAVGGNMVRRMIAAAEQALIEGATAQVRQAFRQQAFTGQQTLGGQQGTQTGQFFQGQGFNQAQVQQAQQLAQQTPNPLGLNVPTAQ